MLHTTLETIDWMMNDKDGTVPCYLCKELGSITWCAYHEKAAL